MFCLDPGAIVAVVLRVTVPLTILRYPVGGFVLSLVLDGLDMPIAYGMDTLLNTSEEPFVGGLYYHAIDKWLDLYFLSLAAFVSWRWSTNGFRTVSLCLLILRIIGIALFEITGNRMMLFFFPNVYEFFYICSAAARKWAPRIFPNTPKKLVIILVIVCVPKLILEYFMHVRGLSMGEIISLITPFELPCPTLWESVISLFQES